MKSAQSSQFHDHFQSLRQARGRSTLGCLGIGGYTIEPDKLGEGLRAILYISMTHPIRRHMRPASIVLLFVILGCSAIALAAEEKIFNQPRWFDDRLDWCLTWATSCGKPAADNFCKRRRFSSASNFAADPGVGHTRVSGTNQVCNGSFCTGFKFITCTGPVPQGQVFANPVWNGYRLDVCLTWAAKCGKPAADKFCQSNGFTEAIASVPDAERGRSPTRLIGTNQICNQSCVGFQNDHLPIAL